MIGVETRNRVQGSGAFQARQIRFVGAEPAEELQRGKDFPDGNCMQPDRSRGGLFKRARQSAEALRQGAPVAAVLEAAEEEIK